MVSPPIKMNFARGSLNDSRYLRNEANKYSFFKHMIRAEVPGILFRNVCARSNRSAPGDDQRDSLICAALL